MSLPISHIPTCSRINRNRLTTHVIDLTHPLKMNSQPKYSFFFKKSHVTHVLPLVFSFSAINAKEGKEDIGKNYQMRAQTLSCTNSLNDNIEDYVLEKVSSVNKALEEAVLLKEPLKLHESMRYSLLAMGCKRDRAVLCIAACELMGGKEATAMPTACAVEMIHTAFLILADLPSMNNINSSLRWGIKPLNHEIFGEQVAVLAANALLALAFEHVATATKGVDSERIVGVVAELAKCMGSQGLAYEHLMISVGKPDFGMERVDGEFFNKPAALFAGSLVLGAIIGGADDQQVSAFREFAGSSGTRFKVADDFLDSSNSSLETEIKAAGIKDAVADTAATMHPMSIGSDNSEEFVEKLKMDAQEQLAAVFDTNKVAKLIALATYICSKDY